MRAPRPTHVVRQVQLITQQLPSISTRFFHHPRQKFTPEVKGAVVAKILEATVKVGKQGRGQGGKSGGGERGRGWGREKKVRTVMKYSRLPSIYLSIGIALLIVQYIILVLRKYEGEKRKAPVVRPPKHAPVKCRVLHHTGSHVLQYGGRGGGGSCSGSSERCPSALMPNRRRFIRWYPIKCVQ